MGKRETDNPDQRREDADDGDDGNEIDRPKLATAETLAARQRATARRKMPTSSTSAFANAFTSSSSAAPPAPVAKPALNFGNAFIPKPAAPAPPPPAAAPAPAPATVDKEAEIAKVRGTIEKLNSDLLYHITNTLKTKPLANLTPSFESYTKYRADLVAKIERLDKPAPTVSFAAAAANIASKKPVEEEHEVVDLDEMESDNGEYDDGDDEDGEGEGEGEEFFEGEGEDDDEEEGDDEEEDEDEEDEEQEEEQEPQKPKQAAPKAQAKAPESKPVPPKVEEPKPAAPVVEAAKPSGFSFGIPFTAPSANAAPAFGSGSFSFGSTAPATASPPKTSLFGSFGATPAASSAPAPMFGSSLFGSAPPASVPTFSFLSGAPAAAASIPKLDEDGGDDGADGEAGPEFEKAEPTKVEKNPNQSGEENEDTLWEAKSKIYVLDPTDKDWKSRGTGNLKLNVAKGTKTKGRFVMRAEGVGTLLINCWVSPKLKVVTEGDKGIKMILPIDASGVKQVLIKTREPAALIDALAKLV